MLRTTGQACGYIHPANGSLSPGVTLIGVHSANAVELRQAEELDKQTAKYGLLVVLTLLAQCAGALGDHLRGQASVINGNTLSIQGTQVRLWGIDAPDNTQICRGADNKPYRCGIKSANELKRFVAQQQVSCKPVSLDQCGHTVAICSVAGIDLGEWLASSGLALDWPKYSGGRYHDAQRRADRAGRGIWGGSYVLPRLYRACLRLGGHPSSCSDDANAHP